MCEDRAVSTTVSYTLTLAISALLVTGLIVAGGDYVDDRQEQVIRGELTVIGQQLASDVAQADRLAVAADSSDPTIRLTQSFPQRVTGTGYRITLGPGGSEMIVLESIDPEIRVTVGFAAETDIGDSTTNGGTVQISYVDSSDTLEVGNG